MRKKRNKTRDATRFFCKKCGSPYIQANWEAITYGTCALMDVVETFVGDKDDNIQLKVGSFDHWEDSDTSNYEITSYFCDDCHTEVDEDRIGDLVTTEVDEVKDLENFQVLK